MTPRCQSGTRSIVPRRDATVAALRSPQDALSAIPGAPFRPYLPVRLVSGLLL
jgi:hypothetical protein